MYPVVRMAKEFWVNRNASPIKFGEFHVSHHVCWPWDLDLWLELNNGRALTLYDLGRLVLAKRTGLLSLLKEKGVTHVVDLIPGDRTSEILTTSKLGLDYFNVPVDWEGPTLATFLNYAAFMQTVDIKEDKVLTHCKLNWRGAAFTYLYRINVLGENEQTAQKDLMAIWHPNPTWFAFMNEVIAHYNEVNGKEVAMSFEAAAPENH